MLLLFSLYNVNIMEEKRALFPVSHEDSGEKITGESRSRQSGGKSLGS